MSEQLLFRARGWTVPYKVYTAILNQSGTNAPVATVLENTLGGTVVWTRESVGTYLGTLTGAFTENKTWCSPTVAWDGSGPYGAKFFRLDANTLYLGTFDGAPFALDDILDGMSANKGFAIEVRVYR